MKNIEYSSQVSKVYSRLDTIANIVFPGMCGLSIYRLNSRIYAYPVKGRQEQRTYVVTCLLSLSIESTVDYSLSAMLSGSRTARES